MDPLTAALSVGSSLLGGLFGDSAADATADAAADQLEFAEQQWDYFTDVSEPYVEAGEAALDEVLSYLGLSTTSSAVNTGAVPEITTTTTGGGTGGVDTSREAFEEAGGVENSGYNNYNAWVEAQGGTVGDTGAATTVYEFNGQTYDTYEEAQAAQDAYAASVTTTDTTSAGGGDTGGGQQVDDYLAWYYGPDATDYQVQLMGGEGEDYYGDLGTLDASDYEVDGLSKGADWYYGNYQWIDDAWYYVPPMDAQGEDYYGDNEQLSADDYRTGNEALDAADYATGNELLSAEDYASGDMSAQALASRDEYQSYSGESAADYDNAWNAFTSYTQSDYYDWLYNEGLDTLNQQLATQGDLYSGQALTAAQEYGQNYAASQWQDFLDQSLALADEQRAQGEYTLGTDLALSDEERAQADQDLETATTVADQNIEESAYQFGVDTGIAEENRTESAYNRDTDLAVADNERAEDELAISTDLALQDQALQDYQYLFDNALAVNEENRDQGEFMLATDLALADQALEEGQYAFDIDEGVSDQNLQIADFQLGTDLALQDQEMQDQAFNLGVYTDVSNEWRDAIAFDEGLYQQDLDNLLALMGVGSGATDDLLGASSSYTGAASDALATEGYAGAYSALSWEEELASMLSDLGSLLGSDYSTSDSLDDITNALMGAL